MPKIDHQMGKLLCLCHWHLWVGGYVQTSKAPLPIEVALLRLKINALQSASPRYPHANFTNGFKRMCGMGVGVGWSESRVRGVELLPSLTYFSVAALRRVSRRRLHEDDEDGEDDGEDPPRPAAHCLRQRCRRHRRGGSRRRSAPQRPHGGVSLAAILFLALKAVIPRNPLLRSCPSQRFA